MLTPLKVERCFHCFGQLSMFVPLRMAQVLGGWRGAKPDRGIDFPHNKKCRGIRTLAHLSTNFQ